MKLKQFTAIALATGGLALAGSAGASLSNSYQFNGNGNWSIDGVGSNSTPVGDISALVPTGSTIEKAFLYSTMVPTSAVPTVDFDGNIFSGSDWVNLGTTAGLTAYRVDVTAQVSSVVGSGSALPFTFTVNSESPNSSTDGEVLAIVYSNPSEVERTIAFLDGFSATTGDNTSINLSDPLTSTQLADPSFEAIMSLGIGYGYQAGGNQVSQVDVNGQRLTSCAGGQDDGISANGGLITVGGLGDDTANPTNPNCNASNFRNDDELYTLEPFLAAGDTVISIDTINPSNNDNIFFAGLNLTARAGVDQPPPDSNPVPTPGILGLLGIGLTSLGFARRRRKA